MPKKLKNIKHLVNAIFACLLNGIPARKMKVIAVTGTDGKTTTVNLIYHILRENGVKVAMISTTGAEIDGKNIFKTLHTTTPSPFVIQKFIRTATLRHCTHIILETSSHAIDQNRIFGCNIKTAVLTNITHEHLDYHKTYDNYLETKSKLLKKAKIRIYNADDDSFQKIKDILKNDSGKNITYGINSQSDYKAGNITTTEERMSFNISYPGGKVEGVTTSLIGNFNVENILAAFAVVYEEKLDTQGIKKAIGSFGGIPGRMELVNKGQPYRVIVDFALTPGAFEKVLPVVKSIIRGKLIHVFGAAGDRDKSKRPILGEIAAKFDDLVILTTDDTHTEKLEEIIPMIEEGLKRLGWEGESENAQANPSSRRYLILPDRKKAITYAVNMAQEDDTILLSGMGHQTTMNLGGKEVPWSDKEEVIKAIEERENRQPKS